MSENLTIDENFWTLVKSILDEYKIDAVDIKDAIYILDDSITEAVAMYVDDMAKEYFRIFDAKIDLIVTIPDKSKARKHPEYNKLLKYICKQSGILSG